MLSNKSSQRRPPIADRSCNLSKISDPSQSENEELMPEPDLCTCTPGEKHLCWDVDYEVYGVIHNNDIGCITCNDFASHIHHSRQQKVRGIEEAYAKMHEHHDILWRRGLKEGARRYSSAAPLDDLQVFEEDLNIAQIKQAKAEEELKYLTRVVLGQISLVEFLSTFTHPTFATREEFWSSMSDTAAANTTKGLWNDDVNVENLILAQDSSLRHITPDFQLKTSAEVSDIPPRLVSAKASLRRRAETSSQVSTNNHIGNHSSSSSAIPRPSPSTENPTISRHIPNLRPGEDIPGYYDDNFRTRDLREVLTALFDEAHSGDSDALAKCKALCREAHMVDTPDRTFGMRYVLIHWKKPPLPDSSLSRTSRRPGRNRHRDRRPGHSSNTSSVVLVNPKLTDSAEVWFEYLRMHSLSWPNGVRKQSNGDPWMADLRASRMFAQFRPLHEDMTYIRNQFTIATLSLFTDKGRYNFLVRQLGLRISPVAKGCSTSLCVLWRDRAGGGE
ncbi:hypothetical protein F5876DRAFT_69476 [Lentinula aff. lateritia]|uniref:Uncharacterized protein n=1 Tax=Lentinula aff. lateritia TaxID=2804960 RepID=A0ACC1TM34_9AGAR|nr:hypothetical protein F5876DRAFT_69476 [Lentinula aff. lateritia]